MKTAENREAGYRLIEQCQMHIGDAQVLTAKLAQEIKNLTATNARLEAQLAERNEEAEVLRKAVSDGGRFLLIAANRYASGSHTECRAMMSMAAIALGVELQWPKTLPHIDAINTFVRAFNTGHEAKHAKVQAAAEPAPSKPSKLTPCEQVRLERHEQWMDAQKTPPDVGHAVIGMVNGTTKTRAVYYVAKTGKWVDVNDRPVTVSQWRHL